MEDVKIDQLEKECPNCSQRNNTSAQFCSKCGYPVSGDESEVRKFEYRIKLREDILQECRKKIRNVKILLFVMAGLNTVFGLFYLFGAEDAASAISSFITSMVFIGCAILVNKHPLTGVIIAFSFYILLQLSVVFIDPALIFSGLILKIVFIAIFVKGIYSAYDIRKYTKELNDLRPS